MKKLISSRIWSVLILLVPVLLACSLFSQAAKPTEVLLPGEPVQAIQPAGIATAPAQPAPTTASGGAPIRQWASAAEASTEYGNPDWNAGQATGAPNTLECGDIETAWAASGRDTTEWINLYFATPVYATEIRVIQTYNPDQVVQVDLIDMQGNFVPAYTGQPKQVETPCPYTLTIPVSRSDVLAQGVRVTINQSVLQLGWNEIDAVEIVGSPGEGVPVRPPSPAP